MKPRALLATLILLTASASAVYSQKRALPDMPAKRLVWQEGQEFADSFYSEGVMVRVIKNSGVIVAVVCYDYRDHLACEVTVLNGADRRIDVLPENFFMVGTYENGEADYVFSLPPTKLAKKYESRAKWGNFFRAFAAGMATTTSTSRVTGDVRGTITTTSPNVPAQRDAAAANREALDEAKAKGDSIILYSLMAHTVFPNKHISGMVYFQRKKFHTAFLNMIIDGTAYSFGFNRPK
jgi:hypothetical protein